ncbi:MAG: hypothetical protein AAFP90_13805 [Planctomycetota bacterium]
MSADPYASPTNSLRLFSICGDDAAKMLHNVTTNDVRSLTVGWACETFVTNVKGKSVGHGWVIRIDPDRSPGFADDGFWFLGYGDQFAAVTQHIDHYAIVEDVRFEDLAQQYRVQYLNARQMPNLDEHAFQPGDPGKNIVSPARVSFHDTEILLHNDLGGAGSGLKISAINAHSAEASASSPAPDTDERRLSETEEMTRDRIENRFPVFGVDITDANLPQEADRDDRCISFTKGCYLGQETIARLDAMGQVQRKLLAWQARDKSDTDTILSLPIELFVEDPSKNESKEDTSKPVAKITSLDSNAARALGLSRRKVFEAGKICFDKLGGSWIRV